MRKAQIIVAVATLIGSIQALAPAEQEAVFAPAKQEAKQEQVVKYYEVWGTSTNEPNRERPWSERQFDNMGDAERELEKTQRSYAKGGLLESDSDKPLNLRVKTMTKTITKSVVDKLKEVKDGALKVKEIVDKVKEIQKNDLKAKEHQPGDTIKEYTKRIEDTFKDIKTLESKMKSTVGKISQKQFDEVNNLIASYNQARNGLGRVLPGGVLDNFPAKAPLGPKDFNLEPEKPTGKYVVWVFKQVGNKWEKQEDQSFSSDEMEQAEKYFNEAKVRAGYSATSNLPKKPKAAQSPVGTYESTGILKGGERYVFTWELRTDGTATSTLQKPSLSSPFVFQHKWDIRDGKVYVNGSDYTFTDEGFTLKYVDNAGRHSI